MSEHKPSKLKKKVLLLSRNYPGRGSGGVSRMGGVPYYHLYYLPKIRDGEQNFKII